MSRVHVSELKAAAWASYKRCDFSAFWKMHLHVHPTSWQGVLLTYICHDHAHAVGHARSHAHAAFTVLRTHCLRDASALDASRRAGNACRSGLDRSKAGVLHHNAAAQLASCSILRPLLQHPLQITAGLSAAAAICVRRSAIVALIWRRTGRGGQCAWHIICRRAGLQSTFPSAWRPLEVVIPHQWALVAVEDQHRDCCSAADMLGRLLPIGALVGLQQHCAQPGRPATPRGKSVESSKPSIK